MEQILLLSNELDTNRYSFINGNDFSVEKFAKYIDTSTDISRLLDHARQVGKEQSINYGLEFIHLYSSIGLIAKTQRSLKQIATGAVNLEHFENVLDYLDWDNTQRNGMSISHPEYKPTTLIDHELFKVFEFAIEQGEKIPIKSEANLLFDQTIVSTKENDQ